MSYRRKVLVTGAGGFIGYHLVSSLQDLGYWVRGLSGTFSKALPPDAFAGAGAGMEFLLVVPSLDLVVVRNGLASARTPAPRAYTSSGAPSSS